MLESVPVCITLFKTNLLKKLDVYQLLNLQAPIPKNGQTLSNNSSAVADEFFKCI